MKPNIENLKLHYKELSDEKLIELTTLEARSLHPEAIEIIRAEILSRGLSEDLFKGIDVQLNPIDEKTFFEYCEFVQIQPCPICNKIGKKLNAAIVEKVDSIVIATTHKKKLVIACPDCLGNELDSANVKGVPGGIFSIFKMLTASNNNRDMKGMYRDDRPNSFFQSFVWRNLGAIEVNKGNKEELRELLLAAK